MEKIAQNLSNWTETLGKLGRTAMENIGFLLLGIMVVAVIIAVAYVSEKAADRKNHREEEKKMQHTKRIVIIAMLAAIAIILNLFSFPLTFLPVFYKIDASELPVIIGAFTLGPAAGVVIEFVKILLNLLFNGTTTAFVGEFANFLIGCAFVVPASIFYYFKKTKRNAAIGLAAGLVICTVSGCLLNAYLLLPAYGKAFHMDISKLVAMGTAVNGMIHSLLTFVIFATAPLNIIKCGVVSLLAMLIYKPISRILKGNF